MSLINVENNSSVNQSPILDRKDKIKHYIRGKIYEPALP